MVFVSRHFSRPHFLTKMLSLVLPYKTNSFYGFRNKCKLSFQCNGLCPLFKHNFFTMTYIVIGPAEMMKSLSPQPGYTVMQPGVLDSESWCNTKLNEKNGTSIEEQAEGNPSYLLGCPSQWNFRTAHKFQLISVTIH